MALRERGIETCLIVDASSRTGSMLVVHEGSERSMVADRGVGSVSSVRGETLVRYSIDRGDVAKLMVALEAMGRLLST